MKYFVSRYLFLPASYIVLPETFINTVMKIVKLHMLKFILCSGKQP